MPKQPPPSSFRTSGLQDFRTSGLQDFRTSGLQDFRRLLYCSLDSSSSIGLTNFSGRLLSYLLSVVFFFSLLFMPSLQAYGIEEDTLSIGKTDDHHLFSSNQQPVTFEKSATSGVRQESSSEESSSADAFAPFLGSVWEFHVFDPDSKSIGELIGTFTFDNAIHIEDSETELYVISDNKTECDNASVFQNLFYTALCTLSAKFSSSAKSLYGIISVHLYYNVDISHIMEKGIDIGDEIRGRNSLFTFNCTTPTCDIVVGILQEWFWKGDYTNKKPNPDYTFQFIGQRLSASSPSGQTNTPSNNTLPPLGGTAALDVNGTAIPTETTYSGGISINGGDYQTQVVQNLADKVDVLGNITVDPNHVGQVADIFVFAAATLPSSESVSYFTLGQDLSILPWDQDSTHLAAFQPDVSLGPTQVVSIYQGTFFYPGTLKVYFGYRLKDGTVVMHRQPIDITINQ